MGGRVGGRGGREEGRVREEGRELHFFSHPL